MQPKFTIIKTGIWQSKDDEGKFFWSRYWQQWSRIVSVRGCEITERDMEGANAGKLRTHSTSLSRGDIISDQMFRVKREHII